MSARRTLDVSHLPASAFGSRDPLWWGVVMLMCIESTVFVLLLISYFYVRGNFDMWPPTGLSTRSQGLAALNLGLLLLSCVPIHWSSRAAGRSELRGMRWGLLLGMVLGVAFFTVRVLEMKSLAFRWDSHAYGSVFWMYLGLHTVHVITGSLEDLLLAVVLFRGPVEEKLLVDVRVNALYWYFVVGSWVVGYAVLFLEPVLLGK